MESEIPASLQHPLIFMLPETDDGAGKGGQTKDDPGNWNELFEPAVCKINPLLRKRKENDGM